MNRIGFRPMVSEPFPLEPLQRLVQDLTMGSVRTTLPAVVVRNDDRCEERMREGSLAATLWEEIRTALTANVLTYRHWSEPLHVTQFRREVTRGGDIVNEWVTGSRVGRGPPFGTLPVDLLVSRGFMFESGPDEMTFAAPDAALLLSEQFVSTHCFGAVAGREGLVGLQFQPVRGRRVPDVRGTLWVDRSTSELRAIDYSYTGLPTILRQADLGGRLEFERLSSGAWIVSYWHIRMPRIEAQGAEFETGARGMPRATRAAQARVTGYVDEGGRVTTARDATPGVPTANVVGSVFDSTTGTPAAGAVIRVQGEADSVITDAEGRFRLAVESGGRRTIAAIHPKLGIIADESIREVTLSAGDSVAIDFAVPSIASFARELCGSTRNRSGIVGIARDETGAAIDGLELRAVFSPTAGAVREERTRVGSGGLYAFCDLPPGTSLTIQLRHGAARAPGLSLGGGRVIAQQVVRLKTGVFQWLDIRR